MRVSVIGTGTMGRGLVQLFCQANEIEEVCWIGRSIEACDVALKKLLATWLKLVEKEKISNENFDSFYKKIRLESKYENLNKADFLIEAVSECIETKKRVFAEASRFLRSEVFFASNTSSLSITEIASVARVPENVIGLHFFNPAPLMSLTEVVVGMVTSNEAKNFGVGFSKLLEKRPVVVNEAPGFIVNRMLIPMINEAIGILGDGVATAEHIDNAMKNGANHPIGPLALADMIGNDVCLSIMEVLHNETGDPKYRANPLLRKMVRAGLLGRKSGSGFFDYK